MLTLHKDSHIDHVPPLILGWALGVLNDRDAFFIETLEIPVGFPEVMCDLYGPLVGDPPIPEGSGEWGYRGVREYKSRLVDLPPRPTRKVTVIAGKYAGESCVLFTIFGGPQAPKEINDPTLKEEERDASVKFWAIHALSCPTVGGR